MSNNIPKKEFTVVMPEGVDPSKPICCIYRITNLENGMKYVGQTRNYRKRSSDYRNALTKKENNYPIYRAMRKFGPEKFKMEVLEVCDQNIDANDLHELEFCYIIAENALEPAGYNNVLSYSTSNSDETRRRKSLSHIGLKESAATKRKKSNRILAISFQDDPEEKDIIIICDSGKLFGDYVMKSKDYIKNCLRQPSTVGNMSVYYFDYSKRQDIRSKMMVKRSIRNTQYMDTLDKLDAIWNAAGSPSKIEDELKKHFTVMYLTYEHVINGKLIPSYSEDLSDIFGGTTEEKKEELTPIGEDSK